MAVILDLWQRIQGDNIWEFGPKGFSTCKRFQLSVVGQSGYEDRRTLARPPFGSRYLTLYNSHVMSLILDNISADTVCNRPMFRSYERNYADKTGSRVMGTTGSQTCSTLISESF